MNTIIDNNLSSFRVFTENYLEVRKISKIYEKRHCMYMATICTIQKIFAYNLNKKKNLDYFLKEINTKNINSIATIYYVY